MMPSDLAPYARKSRDVQMMTSDLAPYAIKLKSSEGKLGEAPSSSETRKVKRGGTSYSEISVVIDSVHDMRLSP